MPAPLYECAAIKALLCSTWMEFVQLYTHTHTNLRGICLQAFQAGDESLMSSMSWSKMGMWCDITFNEAGYDLILLQKVDCY